MIEEQRTYTIPLRRAYQDKPPYKRAPTAVRTIKTFLSKHMSVDEDDVKLSSPLNETVWADGAANPPAKITVVAHPRDEQIRVMTEDEQVKAASFTEDTSSSSETTSSEPEEEMNEDELIDEDSLDDEKGSE